ncbi:putative amidase [Trematosphaeria pertusa]|uniref:Putative amidase n=1 Tax=Trematosphaeria pertusa TaxID=390896 RepID=A0A6A6HSF6_9PLEO|nr:putative amidase [Trematosphaeria pertusa]KAF2240819.1 putative amidase [Trematosphaeria pertusa]
MSSSEAGTDDVISQLQSNDTGRFSAIHQASGPTSNPLPSGPYFLHGSNIHQAWRLYDDELDAFVFAVIPEDLRNPLRSVSPVHVLLSTSYVDECNNRYKVVESLSVDGIWRAVAVPSRMYARPTAEFPLAGARVAIKDIYKLAGVKSTMSSRDYTQLYGPDQESADYVQKLISLGAVIVGKTRMTSFAASDEPTDQYIDFHCPVNPRGDRYQSPSGSSSGAAAALAGYPWLDFSLGSDSAGSIRAPASCNGLFSLRSSFNTTSMHGVAINSPAFDVVGHFSRTLDDLSLIVSSSLDLPTKWTKYPSKILYPKEFFPHSNAKHQSMVEELISILEKFLGTQRVEFSIADRWAQCPPEEASGKTLKEYLAKSAFWAMCRDYNKMFERFHADYEEKYGKEPYEGAVVKFRWGIGKAVSDEQYQEHTHELKVFRDWFNKNVMTSDPESLSDAIMLMPYGSANPKYRDTPNETPSTSHTIGEKFISPVLHMPQLVLPFAQMPYESRISGRLEHRPIVSTLVGARGSDLMLINLAKAAFEAVSWPTTIATGRYMFSLGDNNRNVGDEQVVEPDGGFLHNNKQMASMLSVSDTFGGQHPML